MAGEVLSVKERKPSKAENNQVPNRVMRTPGLRVGGLWLESWRPLGSLTEGAACGGAPAVDRVLQGGGHSRRGNHVSRGPGWVGTAVGPERVHSAPRRALPPQVAAGGQVAGRGMCAPGISHAGRATSGPVSFFHLSFSGRAEIRLSGSREAAGHSQSTSPDYSARIDADPPAACRTAGETAVGKVREQENWPGQLWSLSSVLVSYASTCFYQSHLGH